jgi:hypothetical protein
VEIFVTHPQQFEEATIPACNEAATLEIVQCKGYNVLLVICIVLDNIKVLP